MHPPTRWKFRRFTCIVSVAVLCLLLFQSVRLPFDVVKVYSGNTPLPLGRDKANITTVAFVITITGCKADYFVFDAAAVLAYSIHQSFIHGRYDYDLYVFHHPNASECALPLERLGYIVEERDTPVAMADIRNEDLQWFIQEWGCCGERELIKFEVFTLTQYPVVVMLDADTLVLQPMDRLFDFILDATKVPEPDDLMYVGKPATFGMNTNVTIPEKIDVLYTNDYTTIEPERLVKPTQGGFVIIRPNMTVYNDILEIVREGDYDYENKTGWGGLTGFFWGDTTFQGLMPYYFQFLYPGRALELNYCVWNSINCPPLVFTPDSPDGLCITNQENCEDCRLRPMEETGLVHYTTCVKPWFCYHHDGNDVLHNEKCAIVLRKWYATRLAMEESWGLNSNRTGNFHPEISLGYCNAWSHEGYEKLELPPELPSSH